VYTCTVYPVIKMQVAAPERRSPTCRRWLKAFPNLEFSTL